MPRELEEATNQPIHSCSSLQECSLQRGLEHVRVHYGPKVDKRPSRVCRQHTGDGAGVATQQVTRPMGDERPAVARGRADREFRARRSKVDEAQEVGRTAMRCDATGRKRRCLEPNCIVQRRTSYEIDAAMQRDQPPAIHTVANLMLSEPDFQEFLTCDEAGL